MRISRSMEYSQKQKSTKIVYPDDRTKSIKILDMICRIVAIILSIMFLINLHTLFGGGGYKDSKIVTLFGYADSRVESSDEKPEIKDRSVVFIKVGSYYNKGDIVQYSDGRKNPVRRVEAVADNEYTLASSDDSRDTVTVKKSNIHGKVIFHTTLLYGFFGWYHTALGALTTVIVVFFLISLGDLIMLPRRKKALEERRRILTQKKAKEEELKKLKEANQAAQREKNETMKGTNKAEKKDKSEDENEAVSPEVISEIGNIEDKSVIKKAKKEKKLNVEKIQISKEMKDLRNQMQREEDEFQKSKMQKKRQKEAKKKQK